MKLKLFLVVIISTFFLIPTIVKAEDDDGKYIKELFKSHLSDLPLIAWIVPTNYVYSDKRLDRLYIYSSESFDVTFDKEYSIPETRTIQKKYHIACEVTDKLYRYKISEELNAVGEQNRVFYSTKPFPDQTTVGKLPFRSSSSSIGSIFKLHEISDKLHLHKFFSIRTRGSEFIYSFHGLYDLNSKELYRYGIILQNANGDILSRKFWDIDWDTVCDGCGIPQYSNDHPDNPELDMVESFQILNSFNIPKFKYPVLLMDTSTIEGRALSFITFTDKGEYSEYRVYEYVVNCF